MGSGAATIKGNPGGNAVEVVRAYLANQVIVRDLAATGTAVSRNSGSWGFHIETSNGITADNIEVGPGVSSGIHANKSNRVRLLLPYVHDNLADGVHFTNGDVLDDSGEWGDFIVIGGFFADTGDDALAVVSYGVDADPFPQVAQLRRAIFLGSTVKNSGAAGAANHGAADAIMAVLAIDGTASHGVRIDGEGTYQVTSPERSILGLATIKDAGQLAASGSFHGISVQGDPGDTGSILTGVHIKNPRNSAVHVDGSRTSIEGLRVNMGDSPSNAVVIGSTTNTSRDVPHATSIDGLTVDVCNGGGLYILAPSDDHAKGISVRGVTLINPNLNDVAGTHGFHFEYLDDVLLTDYVVRDEASNLDRVVFMRGCNNVTIGPGVIPAGGTFEFVDCTGVLMPMRVQTTNPSDTTTYRAGQEWLNTANGRHYIFDGTAWKYAALT